MSEYLEVNGENVKRQVCERYSRIVGYFSPLSQWNDGKKQEFKDRKTFKVE